MQKSNKFGYSAVCLLVFMAGLAVQADKVNVVILTGSNNHNWKGTTPVLKQVLEEAGSFDVDVVTDPEKLTAEVLANYDVILSNWNAFGKGGVAPWSEQLKAAYVDFVRNGGGHVVVHAGSSSFFDWKEYQAIGCATWKGKTGHKHIHEFEVRISDSEHPVTRGLKNFKVTDELWYKPFVQPEAEVLAESFSKTTGKWEPTALAGNFGKGRCFTLLLGHNVENMQSDGFKTLLARGTAWVAGAGDGVEETENSISMRLKGKTVWTLNHRPDQGKPYFHPLATTTGEVFSDLRPKDHPWHRALWFSWKFINGINYWEENPSTGKSRGQTLLLSTKRKISPENEVRVDMTLAYAPAGDTTQIMREKRVVFIAPPDENGVYAIDWSSEFQALENDVVLDRTPIPGQLKGRGYGGYAGWSIRMNKDVKGGVFLNSEGLIGMAAHRQAARWTMYTAVSGGTLIFMDHPENLRYPAKWYIAEKMPYFGPAVIMDAPHTIKAGELLKLRYRLMICPAAIDALTAQKAWEAWSTSAK